MAPEFPTEVGPQDTVVIHVTGVKAGGDKRGLPTQIVNETILLTELFDKYAPEEAKSGEVDMSKLQDLAKSNPAKFQQEWAKIGTSMTATSGTALPDRVIKAVCGLLEDRGLIVSKTDPGKNEWYVNPDDFQPVVQKHKADGWQWFVALAAPFG